MFKQNIGNLILHLREEMGITRKNLCEGLCGVRTLLKLEEGKIISSIFLIDRLLQRMGKSPDMFEVILSDKEYDSMIKKDEIEQLINFGNLIKAEKELDIYIKTYKEPQNIQQQYYYQIRAVLEAIKENHEVCIEYLQKSINITVPYFSIEKKQDSLLCITEIELLIMLADEYYKVNQVCYAEKLLNFLIDYIQEHYTDSGELVKIYPKAVYLQSIWKKEKGEGIQCIERCEKAFQLMIKEGTTIFLGEIMELLICFYKEIHIDKKTKQLEKQLKSLKEVYEEEKIPFYVSVNSMGWFKESLRRGYYLCSEIVRGQRIALGMSQEQLAEGIYENPESIARVEAGKQMPNLETFTLLMEKLRLAIGHYNSYLVTEDYEILELRKKVNILLSKNDCESAKIELEKLRLFMNKENPINKQYLMTTDTCLDYELKVISEEEFYKRTLEALEITYISKDDKFYRIPMEQESTILNQLAISLWKQGKLEQGIELFKCLDNCYNDGKIPIKYQFLGRGVILKNYLLLLEVANRLEDSEKIYKKGIKQDLEAGKGRGLDMYLTEKVCMIEKFDLDVVKKKKAMSKYLQQAFYISELYDKKENAKLCDAYYRKKISSTISWY